jgi:hypothetical protein
MCEFDPLLNVCFLPQKVMSKTLYRGVKFRILFNFCMLHQPKHILFFDKAYGHAFLAYLVEGCFEIGVIFDRV